MILKGKELEELINKYDAEAEKNYRNYQQTGIRRYERAQHKAEDLADTLRAAQSSVNDHANLVFYRAQLHNFASQARRIKEPGEAEQLLKSIISLAVMENLIQKEE